MPLALALLLGAVAVDLAQTALTRAGVGPFEYATVVLLDALLIQNAFRLFRRSTRRI